MAKNIRVHVVALDMVEPYTIRQDRTINLEDREDRQWLIKTQWWAAHNHVKIVTTPKGVTD